jgi:hypothetical protein
LVTTSEASVLLNVLGFPPDAAVRFSITRYEDARLCVTVSPHAAATISAPARTATAGSLVLNPVISLFTLSLLRRY